MVNVSVYWNLHKDVWSIRSKSGLVVMHAVAFHMSNCRFVVREGGRQRVIRTKQKEVHAFVKGNITDGLIKPPADWIRVRYNPYQVATFVTVDGKPVLSASEAILTSDGKVFVPCPQE